MNKLLINLLLCMVLAAAAGCRHVPMVSQQQDTASKQFNLPSRDMAGIYIYRISGWSGKTQVKSIWLDGQLLGGLANKTYFDFEVAPGTHTLSMQATPGPNDLQFTVEAGRNYYFSEVFSKKVPVVGIIVAPFVSKAGFEEVSEQTGQAGVLECQRAVLQNFANPAKPAPLATTKPDCIADLESDAELRPIRYKVALSGKEDNLAELMAIKKLPTPSERKVILKWKYKREQCFRADPPPRDIYFQLSTETFDRGQELIEQLGRGRMTYGQFAEKRDEIRQASLAKAQELRAQ
jgi:Protein of unknown function (DUF2846)